MSPRFASLSLVAVALSGCASVPLADATLPGRWAPVAAEMGGRPFPIENFAGATLVLTAGTYEFGIDRGTYWIVSPGPPATMDITGREGPNAGRVIPATYALAGDRLVICYQLGSGARPATCPTATGPQVLLVRYARAR